MPPVASSRVVEVVWCDLDPAPGTFDDLSACLSDAERVNAAAKRTPILQRRTVARLGWRRVVLGEAIGVHPRDVHYLDAPGRKPSVRTDGDEVHFSSASSGSWGVLAVSGTVEVGVDVESSGEVADVDALAARIASPAELRWLSSRPASARRDGVLSLWTRKEALLKATGQGLVDELCAIDTSPQAAPGEPVPGGEESWWHLVTLDCPRVDLAAWLAVAAARDDTPPSVVVSRRLLV